ncbi:hypothetical protein GCM10007989_33550 [Devosia pacifica]|uniref:Uncharacterized protein n=1 Tax=Devosia pacifica TaxID=1335967 RepID=A0A918SC41_9HYPH|nr:hypothetical protein [Devosia pacifica]GHA34937.1 hypothetical protein GCM10007989_33550 [Devosia pacifica]
MTNFLEGLRAGLAAHNEVDAEKREIAQIISDLNQQVLMVSDGKVTAVVLEVTQTRSVAEMFGRDGKILPARRVFEALCFKQAAEPYDYRILAEWIEEDGGYPVTVSFDERRIICHDRPSLEQTILQLVQTATSGRALAELRG